MPREMNVGRKISNLLVVFAFLLIVFAIILVTVFKVSTYRIVGTSMNPTLEEKDLVIAAVKKQYKRGDIIVFYLDNTETIKRIIGEPGDVVEIEEDGTVKVNNKELKEKYIKYKYKGDVETPNPYTVAPGEYYVLGDNRGDSKDSRLLNVGAIRDDMILGKIYFSVTDFKFM